MGDAFSELDQWVGTVYGQCQGYIELTTMVPTPNARPVSSHMPIDEWDTVAALQVAEGKNFYIGCCTCKTAPKGRGKYEDRLEMPGLWLDMDIGTVGHAPVANQKPRFDSVEHALEILTAYGFPAPTAVVQSGGGIYPWWLFTSPITMEPDARRDAAQTLSDKWHRRAARIADELGYFQDELADLPRFLRPPGVWNFKAGQRRLTSMLFLEAERRYDPNDLWLVVAAEQVGPIRFSSADAFNRRGDGSGGDGLADVLRGCSWAEILVPARWEFLGLDGDDEEWRRPGGTEEKRSALCARDVMTVFSAASSLPDGRGRKLTKWRVFCHLWFETEVKGQVDWKSAREDLATAAAGGESKAPWPREAVERATELLGLDLEFIRSRSQSPVVDSRVSRRHVAIVNVDGTRQIQRYGSGYRGVKDRA